MRVVGGKEADDLISMLATNFTNGHEWKGKAEGG